jgi:hypothetical protein
MREWNPTPWKPTQLRKILLDAPRRTLLVFLLGAFALDSELGRVRTQRLDEEGHVIA